MQSKEKGIDEKVKRALDLLSTLDSQECANAPALLEAVERRVALARHGHPVGEHTPCAHVLVREGEAALKRSSSATAFARAHR